MATEDVDDTLNSGEFDPMLLKLGDLDSLDKRLEQIPATLKTKTVDGQVVTETLQAKPIEFPLKDGGTFRISRMIDEFNSGKDASTLVFGLTRSGENFSATSDNVIFLPSDSGSTEIHFANSNEPHTIEKRTIQYGVADTLFRNFNLKRDIDMNRILASDDLQQKALLLPPMI